MLKLYKFYWDYGRMGGVHGLFVADEKTVKNAVGQEVDFGEILGKHSEIDGRLESVDFTVMSEDQHLIESLLKVFPQRTLCGYNPLDCLEDE